MVVKLGLMWIQIAPAGYRYMHKIEHLNKIAEKFEKLNFLKLARNELYFFLENRSNQLNFVQLESVNGLKFLKLG